MFETMGWLKKSFSVLLSSLGHFSSDKDCFFFFFFSGIHVFGSFKLFSLCRNLSAYVID